MSVRASRQRLIRHLLTERGRVSVDELASTLRVTMMTVRRDLAAMEATGVLTRTHGGCVLQSPFVSERPFAAKDLERRTQKYAIAREAARLLTTGQNVYLDTGTTAVQVARVLPTDRKLRVFTNNLRVAMELFGREGVEVHVFGGRLALQSPDLVGDVAMARIGDFRIDVAMLGADAIDAGRGEFYSADMGTALLSQAAQKHASRTLVLVDSSKFGKQSLAVAGRLGEAVTVVTDEDTQQADLDAVLAAGAKLILATSAGRASGDKHP